MKNSLVAFAIASALGCYALPHVPTLIERHLEHQLVGRADNATGFQNTTDFNPVAITVLDSTGAMQLNPGVDGNMFMSLPSDASSITNLIPGTSQFSVDSNTNAIISDNSDNPRLLYYYPDEMTALKVSRFRLGAWGSIPKGARLLSLVPFQDGTGNKMLVALDTKGNYFWPVLCGFTGMLNKIFVAQDPVQGPSILAGNGDLRYILTGGDVESCGPLALTSDGITASYS